MAGSETGERVGPCFKGERATQKFVDTILQVSEPLIINGMYKDTCRACAGNSDLAPKGSDTVHCEAYKSAVV